MSTQVEPCNENIAPAQSYADLWEFDQFLDTISEDDLYKSFLSDSHGASCETTTVLPELSSLDISLPETIQPAPTQLLPLLQPIKIEPGTEPVIVSKAPVQKISKKLKMEEIKPEGEKYHKRLVANKKSAQASRERKKQMRSELESKVISLTKENADLLIAITAMQTENKVLKEEFIQLQNIINESAASISKLTPIQYDSSTDDQKKVKLSSSPFAAAIYLMIILNSFGQFFNQMSAYQQPALLFSTNNNAVSVAWTHMNLAYM